MSRQEIRIEQIENVADYCRMDASGASPPVGPFQDWDDEAFRLDEDNFLLWLLPNDTLYIGATSPFSVLGFRVGTIIPQNVGLTVEYYDSVTAWTPLTFIYDSTWLLVRDGYITWVPPGNWTLTTLFTDLKTAFWIRVRSTGVIVQGQAHHFMPTITGKPPLLVYPKFEPKEKRFSRDINSTLHRKDVVQKIVKECIVECTQLAFTMGQLNYLRYLIEFRHRCRLTDLAVTNPPNFAEDAYYRYYEGYITGQLDKTASPFKMKPDQYILAMDVDNAMSIFELLGIPPA